LYVPDPFNEFLTLRERLGAKVSVNVSCKTWCFLVTVLTATFAQITATNFSLSIFPCKVISQARCEVPDELDTSELLSTGLLMCPSRLYPPEPRPPSDTWNLPGSEGARGSACRRHGHDRAFASHTSEPWCRAQKHLFAKICCLNFFKIIFLY